MFSAAAQDSLIYNYDYEGGLVWLPDFGKDKGMEKMDQESIAEIGSRLELFVDDYLLDKMEDVSLRLHQPSMTMPEAPLVGHYPTVIKDGDLFRAYYRYTNPAYQGERYTGRPGQVKRDYDAELIGYLESTDGINWQRPDLGLFKDKGPAYANAVLTEPPFCHNFCPFLDTNPAARREERYKALAGVSGKECGVPGGLYAFTSADGINWQRKNEPVIVYNPQLHGPYLAFDSQNLAFWSEAENRYLAFFRHWQTGQASPLRTIGRASSVDFSNWVDESALFITPNAAGEELYTSQVQPYFRAPHIYLAFPTRLTPGRISGGAVKDAQGRTYNRGSTDIMFMTARAGNNHFDRLFQNAFIRPELAPDSFSNKVNYTALNVQPTSPTQMSIYHQQGYRYVLRTDGFASVHAGARVGEMLTKPLVFFGNELVLNLSTAIIGGVQVELQTGQGEAIPGFSAAECNTIFANSIAHVVSWNKGSDVSDLAGKPVRIRFIMQDCDLYSLQFRQV